MANFPPHPSMVVDHALVHYPRVDGRWAFLPLCTANWQMFGRDAVTKPETVYCEWCIKRLAEMVDLRLAVDG